jgi:hypothetical protein
LSNHSKEFFLGFMMCKQEIEVIGFINRASVGLNLIIYSRATLESICYAGQARNHYNSPNCHFQKQNILAIGKERQLCQNNVTNTINTFADFTVILPAGPRQPALPAVPFEP